jgi:hypothetical protein
MLTFLKFLAKVVFGEESSSSPKSSSTAVCPTRIDTIVISLPRTGTQTLKALLENENRSVFNFGHIAADFDLSRLYTTVLATVSCLGPPCTAALVDLPGSIMFEEMFMAEIDHSRIPPKLLTTRRNMTEWGRSLDTLVRSFSLLGNLQYVDRRLGKLIKVSMDLLERVGCRVRGTQMFNLVLMARIDDLDECVAGAEMYYQRALEFAQTEGVDLEERDLTHSDNFSVQKETLLAAGRVVFGLTYYLLGLFLFLYLICLTCLLATMVKWLLQGMKEKRRRGNKEISTFYLGRHVLPNKKTLPRQGSEF